MAQTQPTNAQQTFKYCMDMLEQIAGLLSSDAGRPDLASNLRALCQSPTVGKIVDRSEDNRSFVGQ